VYRYIESAEQCSEAAQILDLASNATASIIDVANVTNVPHGCFVDPTNTGDFQLFWNSAGVYTTSTDSKHQSVCAAAAAVPSGSPSVAPTIEGGIGVVCSAHGDCGHNGASHTYCDDRRTCFNCDYCVNIQNDAIDGTCPSVCTQETEVSCNAHTECSGTEEYCDQSNDCYGCSYCVNINNDAIDGSCPEWCNAFYNGNRNGNSNSDNSCSAHSQCSHNGQTHTYCDTLGQCFNCDFCVNVMMDAIDGSCPAVCQQYDTGTASNGETGAAACNIHADCPGTAEYCDRFHDCFACTYCVNIHNDAIDGRCPAVCYRDGVGRPARFTRNDDDDASAHGYTTSVMLVFGGLSLVGGCAMAIAAASRKRANERRAANDGGNRDEVPPIYREIDTEIHSVQNPQYDNAMSGPRASALSVDEDAQMLPLEVGASAHASPTGSEQRSGYMDVFPAGHSAPNNPFTALGDCDGKPPGYDDPGIGSSTA
jgi:hypothetical protein